MNIGLNAEGSSTRSVGRRLEDNRIRRQIERFESLFLLGQTITSEMRLNRLFLLINQKTNEIMKARRSTVFLYDENEDTLWSFVATGMKEGQIRIPADTGVAGWVFKHKASALINDVYKDPRFYRGVDENSGFKTRSMLCIPLINRHDTCIGVLQVLNARAGKFTAEDELFLNAISHYVAIALENAKLYHDTKVYAEDLKKALILNESLEKLKRHLTKFVPPSVVSMAEQAPESLGCGKTPMAVSILFVDVAGFSIMTEKYDQEMVNHMIETHFSAYLSCVAANGGEVNETSGDGVMVIFKADLPGNHADAAVKSGLSIIEENRRLNAEFNYPWGPVDLHMGISSGRAHVGTTRMKGIAGERWTYTASGIVTVLASRIGALSETSRLFISGATHRKIADCYDCQSLGKKKLKNVSRAVEVYWVKGTHPPEK